jgi:hypothetical protein
MDPVLLATLAQQHADIAAIVQIVGWENVFKIIPHAMNIGAAYQKNLAAAPHSAGMQPGGATGG